MTSATEHRLADTLAVHTDAPQPLLRTMVSETEVVLSRSTAGGGEDCIFGWGEALEPERGCRPHNMIYTEDEETARWVARTLVTLGYQVTVSSAMVWSEQREDMPTRDDDHHQH